MHIYLAERGIDIELEEVGGADSKLTPDYVAKYPHAMVPALELDDCTMISETIAIARYSEERYLDPPILGTDAKDKAVVEMWGNRTNEEGMHAASELFRNTHPAFAERGMPGSAESIPHIPGLVDRGKARLVRFFKKFDTELANNEVAVHPELETVSWPNGADFAPAFLYEHVVAQQVAGADRR